MPPFLLTIFAIVVESSMVISDIGGFKMKPLSLRPAARNAIFIGGMCSISYLAVYIARNMLSSTSTQMEELGVFSVSQLGALSSV